MRQTLNPLTFVSLQRSERERERESLCACVCEREREREREDGRRDKRLKQRNGGEGGVGAGRWVDPSGVKRVKHCPSCIHAHSQRPRGSREEDKRCLGDETVGRPVHVMGASCRLSSEEECRSEEVSQR